jgi:hypothetical protein
MLQFGDKRGKTTKKRGRHILATGGEPSTPDVSAILSGAAGRFRTGGWRHSNPRLQ